MKLNMVKPIVLLLALSLLFLTACNSDEASQPTTSVTEESLQTSENTLTSVPQAEPQGVLLATEVDDIKPLYSCLDDPSGANYVRFFLNGKCGLLDLDGNVAMSAEYYDVITEDYSDIYLLPDDAEALHADNGCYVVAVLRANGTHSFMKKGLQEISGFTHGHGLDEIGLLYNTDDTLLYDSSYGEITPISVADFNITPESNYCSIVEAVSGEQITDAGGMSDFANRTGKYALLKNYSELLTDFIYTDGIITAKSDIIAMKSLDGKWGYIKKDGTKVSECIYDENPDGRAYSFTDGFCAVIFDGKGGIINEKGAFVLSPTHEKAILGKNGTAFVYDSDQWSIVKLKAE